MAGENLKIEDDDDILDDTPPQRSPLRKAVDPVPQLKDEAANLRIQLNAEREARMKAERSVSDANKTAAETRFAATESSLAALKARRERLLIERREALTSCDYDRESKLTDELADVAAESSRFAREIAEAKRAAGEGRQQSTDTDQQPKGGDPFEAWVAERTPAARSFIREHESDFRNAAKLKKIGHLHGLAEADGLTVDSQEYFDFISEHMGYKPKDEPDDDAGGNDGDGGEEVEIAQPRKRVSAPVTRDGGSQSASSNKIRLTPEQIEMAENFGMSKVEYAKFLQQSRRQDAAKRG